MKAALFDLDGVLTDTEGIYSRFWTENGKRFGVPFDDFSQRIKGTTLEHILSTYFPADKHQEIVDVLIDFEKDMPYPLFPGVIDYLEKLKQGGIPCAVVTSSGDMKMERLWKQHPGFRDYFKAVITDSQVERSKPDPQGYLLAAQALGVDPKDCYVYEDSINGLKAARASGATVVGIATTNPRSVISPLSDLLISELSIKEMEQAEKNSK